MSPFITPQPKRTGRKLIETFIHEKLFPIFRSIIHKSPCIFLRCAIPVVLSNNNNKLMVHMYTVKNTTIFLIVRLLLIRYNYMFRPSMLAIFRLYKHKTRSRTHPIPQNVNPPPTHVQIQLIIKCFMYNPKMANIDGRNMQLYLINSKRTIRNIVVLLTINIYTINLLLLLLRTVVSMLCSHSSKSHVAALLRCLSV